MKPLSRLRNTFNQGATFDASDHLFFSVNKSAVTVPPPVEAPEAPAIGTVSVALSISMFATIFVLDIAFYIFRHVSDKHLKATRRRRRDYEVPNELPEVETDMPLVDHNFRLLTFSIAESKPFAQAAKSIDVSPI